MKPPKFPHCATFAGAMNVGKTEYLFRIHLKANIKIISNSSSLCVQQF